MAYTLDYNESIPKVVTKLIAEHRQLEPKLLQIEQLSKGGDVRATMRQLTETKTLILRHAVEEEARLMRVIMWEFEDESYEAIAILRHHRQIVDFLERGLPKLAELPDRVWRREVGIFLKELKQHLKREEEVVFPLAIEANSVHENRNR